MWMVRSLLSHWRTPLLRNPNSDRTEVLAQIIRDFAIPIPVTPGLSAARSCNSPKNRLASCLGGQIPPGSRTEMPAENEASWRFPKMKNESPK
jgi:hypothetical protein